LVVASGQERAEPGRLADLVARAGVSVAAVPPSLLDVLRPGGLGGVGTLITVGERLEAGLAARWRDHHRLLNGYGPTETVVACCVFEVAAGADVLDPVPIGSPVANTRVYVLDARLCLVPVGVAGEVFIAGAQVARGYGRRPVLTAERFVADPFAGDGSRMYRTGDRARWRADGVLVFVGRADDQVKVRGFRVEPGEIEAVLAAHPGVRSAVVAAFGDDATRRLVAYLVPADPAEGIPPVAELRAFAGERLPEFMVPAAFVELADLPLTPNGKIDRAALPVADATRPDLDEFTPPSGAVEELLADIWAEVLGIDRIGARDNFFELGGHSLLATQVVSRIRDAFGVEIPLAALFDQPTIAETAVTITKATLGIDGDTKDYEEFEI
jgi:acyl-coenzyme A synthetase/AMP-(fatty) acid ligase/acyl carrier protein